MRVLVTGGAGFIGCNLVRALTGAGVSVRVLDDLSTGLLTNMEGLDAELVDGSLTDFDAVSKCVAGADAVVHLGARGSVPRSVAEPLATHEVNATGTLVVLEAARAAGAYVVFSSSSSVYGMNRALPKKETLWTQPLSPYGASKLAAESYVMAYREVYEIEALALRLFNVYGPWQRADHVYAAVIPRFASAALHGSPLVIHGDGLQTRDFTHVDSVVQVMVSALEQRLSHDRPINLAFGEPMAILDVADEIERQVGKSLTREFVPARAGDVRDSASSPALLRSLFPSVDPVPFSAGLSSVLEWMMDQRISAT